MRGRKLLFLATEDWFVRSHFMPMLRRAQADGFDVIVAARSSGADLEGVRCIDLPLERRSISPMALLRGARAVRALIDEERPDIVHAIALKPIVMTLCAGGSGARAYAVTGRGYLAIAARAWTRIAQWCVARLLRSAVAKPHAVLLVENIARSPLGRRRRAAAGSQVVLLPGAGVDPAQLKLTRNLKAQSLSGLPQGWCVRKESIAPSRRSNTCATLA
ncbi:MAG: glycosyltransferase [Hyphomonadaceae bacterium]